MFSLVERSVHTARKPFCKFDRSFLVFGITTILGTESINVFTNEKIFQPAGKPLLQKIIQAYYSRKIALHDFRTCLF